MKKTGKILLLLLTAAFAAFCLTSPAAARTAAAEGTDRCLRTVIPSLYAMMAVSGLLIATGAISAAGRLFRRLPRTIFGMDSETFAIFLFSMIAGYPVGARMTATRLKTGALTTEYAALSTGLCFGAGSAFIFGCAAPQPSAGKIVLLSNISANLILALLMSPLLKRRIPPDRQPPPLTISPTLISDSVLAAGRAMGDICFTVTAFSVLIAMLRQTGATAIISAILSRYTGISEDTSAALISALLDVTALSELPADLSLLPAVSALVSFGGLCVFMQISAIFRGKQPLLPLIATRLAAAVISGTICRLLMPLLLRTETVAVSADLRLHRESTPIPSLMLLLMTFSLFTELTAKMSENHSKMTE